MAHIAKYKATSVGHMLAHYRRDASSLERDNIDPKRVENDMVVGHYTNKDGRLVVGRVVPREGEPNWDTVERRIERVNEAQKAAGSSQGNRALMTCCAMRSGRRMRGTATTLHRRGRIAGGLDDVL